MNAQDFEIEDKANKFSLSFQHVGNLIVIPLSINGSQPLNFIIDTGSPHTIITNLEAINYFKLNKARPIQISGLGNDKKSLEAYLSMNNSLKISRLERNGTMGSEMLDLFKQNEGGGNNNNLHERN